MLPELLVIPEPALILFAYNHALFRYIFNRSLDINLRIFHLSVILNYYTISPNEQRTL